MVDLIWLVHVSKDTQLARLMKRNGYTQEEAMARIDAQLSLEEKKERADCIIENDGTWKETLAQVIKAWKSLQ